MTNNFILRKVASVLLECIMHSKMVAMIKEELAIIEKGSCTYSKFEKSASTCGKYL